MRPSLHILLLLFIITGLTAEFSNAQNNSSSPNGEADEPITILAEDYAFQAPDEITSGQNTLTFANNGDESHFLFMTRLPDGKTYEEYSAEIIPLFDEAWRAIRDDGATKEEALGKLNYLPEWFGELEFIGGAGILPAGSASNITLNLRPGTYALECYMKTEDGEVHYMEGMLRELKVTDTPSGNMPPEADINITLSNFEMIVEGDITAGPQTVAVHVKENPKQGFGHNVHVVRMEADTEADHLVRWMRFLELDGLKNPGPATFVGGMQIMPEGETGYFTVDFEPGEYLFVSEHTGHLGVLQDVTIEQKSNSFISFFKK